MDNLDFHFLPIIKQKVEREETQYKNPKYPQVVIDQSYPS